MLGGLCKRCASQLRVLDVLRGGRRFKLQSARQFHLMSILESEDILPSIRSGQEATAVQRSDSEQSDAIAMELASGSKERKKSDNLSDTVAMELASGSKERKKSGVSDVVRRKNNLKRITKEFGARKSVHGAAAEYGLTGSHLHSALSGFSWAVRNSSLVVGLKEVLTAIVAGEGHVDDLFPYFLAYARRHYPMVVGMPQLQRISDLAHPTKWFPAARSMKRKIIYHAGPTNSGKTHHALRHFLSAERAVYCAPLRMLAHEISQRSNDEGVPCDLLTGEEFQPASGDPTHHALHLACTVEMTKTDPGFIYDVGVVDEVQMMEDTSRGGGWTRAILGLPARELHLCGQETALDMVRRMASSMEEELEVHHYHRLAPLVPLDHSLRGLYTNVFPGDCVVTFSRSKIFEVRKSIEMTTKQSCAVIYGGLPPATRVHQARLFNNKNSKCNIMVATDAIGMGMNLNIRRIVFHDLEKFNGSKIVTLTSQSVKQIAGRAGRYGKDYSRGEVTTFHKRDLDLMQELLEAPDRDVEKAGLSPSFEQIQLFSTQMPGASLHEILAMFVKLAKLDGNYFLCDVDEQLEKARVLRDLPISLQDTFILTHSPVDVRKPWVLTALRKFAKAYSLSKPVNFRRLRSILQLPLPSPTTPEQLATFENIHETIDLYFWLSMRFLEYFPATDEARELQKEIEKIIGQSIASRFQFRKVWSQLQSKGNLKDRLLRSASKQQITEQRRTGRQRLKPGGKWLKLKPEDTWAEL